MKRTATACIMYFSRRLLCPWETETPGYKRLHLTKYGYNLGATQSIFRKHNCKNDHNFVIMLIFNHWHIRDLITRVLHGILGTKFKTSIFSLKFLFSNRPYAKSVFYSHIERIEYTENRIHREIHQPFGST